MGQMGQPEHRHAGKLERDVAVVHALERFVMLDLGRFQLPERHAIGEHAIFATRVGDAVEDREIAVAAHRIVCRQGGVIGEQEPQMAGEAVAELVLDLRDIGFEHRAARLDEAHLALGIELVGTAIVGNLGCVEDIGTPGDPHLAGGNRNLGGRVVDQMLRTRH